MTKTRSAGPRERSVLVMWGRGAAVVVLVLAGLNWAGWAIGAVEWTRVFPFWPQMPPWTSTLLAALGAAILVQSGRSSPNLERVGRVVAGVTGVLALVFLAEYLTGRSFGLDQVLFPEEVRTLPDTFPGRRPSLPALSSILLLSIAVTLTRTDRRWSRIAWVLCLTAAVVMPVVTAQANLLGIASMQGSQANSAALGLVLLVVATMLSRPDRAPVAWLIARPDRWPLVRMAGILAGLPIVVGLSRLVLAEVGLSTDAVWALSLGVGTVVVGVGAFYFGQREQKLLIDEEQSSRRRAEVEKRFRILADNAVDVVMHIRGREAVWISPSVEAALGTSPEWWVGGDVTRRVHSDDLDVVVTALGELAQGRPVRVRCRLQATDGVYHWVEGHAKTYVDDEGNSDGVIAAWRVIDDQVAAERRMERLAKFDSLTGLVNRAEAVARFESALKNPRYPGPHLGVLFCDVDHFKNFNDRLGHACGDAVLVTLAARIRECLRDGDTVGRTGGDEMLVLLPGMHNLDGVTQIAKKVRCRAAEPIHHCGETLKATLSIGATLAVAGESIAAVTARADAAMYEAKQAGRNTTVTVSAPAGGSQSGG